MAVALIDEEDVVKTALENLSDYLHKYLRVDASLISGLKRKQLLDESSASQLDALVSKGGGHAVDGLLDYMSSYYDEEMLEKFCSFLDESSKPAKPRFRKIAQKIRDEMKKLQPTPTHPAETERDVDSLPATRNLPSSPPTTLGESTSALFTGDERSQKLKQIVEIYGNSENFSLQLLEDFENDFDRIMGKLDSALSTESPKKITELRAIIRLKYRRYIHGAKKEPLPDVPDTSGGLFDFIAEKSNALEILLVHHAVDVLECGKLKDALEKYEGELAKRLKTTLLSFKTREVTLPPRKDYTHMAVVLSEDQVLLSLVLHIKKYLVKMLHLEEALFEGFAGGCTILVFSILRIDAVLLSPKIISHLSELKRMFEITHLVVFGYFACDLEQASVEVLSAEVDKKAEQLQYDLKTAKSEGDNLRLELKEAEEKSEQLQSEGEKFKNDAIAAKMKLQLKEKELMEAKEKTVNFSEQITMWKSEGDKLRLELKEAEEKSEQLQHELTAAKSEGDNLRLELKEAEKKSDQLQSEGDNLRLELKEAEKKSDQLQSEGDDLRLKLEEAEEKSEQLQSKGNDLRLKLEEAEEKSEQLQFEGDDLRLKLEEAEEKSEQLQSKGEKLQHELTEAEKDRDMFRNSTVKLAEQKSKLESKGEKLQHELIEAEKDRDMFRNSTVKLAEQKSKLEHQIVNIKGSLCKDHLETIEEIEKSLEEGASSISDVLQVEKVLLSASEKFTEDLSASMVKLEEQLSFSKEELSSLRSACKELEDTPSPTEEQKEILSGHKVKMESLESTVSSVQLEYDKVVLKLKCCEMDVLRELPLKEEIGYMLEERTEKIQAIMSTLKAKQEKLERDEYLHEVMEREKREALLKEENEKLKADLKTEEVPIHVVDSKEVGPSSSEVGPLEPTELVVLRERRNLPLESYCSPQNMSEEEADRLLQRKATDGEHLVRKEGEGDLRLSVWQNGTCYHLQIYQKQDEASEAFYSLDEKVYFDSIRKLCDHYKEEPMPGYGFTLRRF